MNMPRVPMVATSTVLGGKICNAATRTTPLAIASRSLIDAQLGVTQPTSARAAHFYCGTAQLVAEVQPCVLAAVARPTHLTAECAPRVLAFERREQQGDASSHEHADGDTGGYRAHGARIGVGERVGRLKP
jgi:hypothetical protein